MTSWEEAYLLAAKKSGTFDSFRNGMDQAAASAARRIKAPFDEATRLHRAEAEAYRRRRGR